MSEDSWPGLVVDGATGHLVTGGEDASAPCWEPNQQERRWSATAAALAALRDSLPAGGQPGRVVDLGCGTGDLTVRVASLWPGAEVVAVDQVPGGPGRPRGRATPQPPPGRTPGR